MGMKKNGQSCIKPLFLLKIQNADLCTLGIGPTTANLLYTKNLMRKGEWGRNGDPSKNFPLPHLHSNITKGTKLMNKKNEPIRKDPNLSWDVSHEYRILD